MKTKRTQLHNINFITCSKAEIYGRAHDPKIYPSPAFHKSLNCDNLYKLCL